jgi:hypothetical protein
MHIASQFLPLLAATLFYIYIICHDTSSTIRVPTYTKRTSWITNTYRYIDSQLSIVSSVRKLTNTIESAILSLDTRTARHRRQTKINLIKRRRATHRPCKKINICRLACMVHVVACTSNLTASPQTRKVIFDTDLVPIRVDNCATASISNDLKYFEGPVTPVRGRGKGITGYTKA